MLHILRDRVKSAKRAKKRGLEGADERLATHEANRAAYRTAHESAKS